MSENIQVKILEVTGLNVAFAYVGLPMGKITDPARMKYLPASAWTDQERVLTNLISQGDEHAKIMRQVTVHMEITAPRYWWQQFATYRAGVEMYSGSTMHTIHNRRVTPEDFSDRADLGIIDLFNDVLVRGDISDTKANLPEGYLQARLVMVSYQTLRRMWLQRRKHKLGEWHEFIEALHELPYCEALIFVEPHNPWRELWQELLDPDKSPWDKWGFCFYCGVPAPGVHDPSCVYHKAKQLLDKEAE